MMPRRVMGDDVAFSLPFVASTRASLARDEGGGRARDGAHARRGVRDGAAGAARRAGDAAGAARWARIALSFILSVLIRVAVRAVDATLTSPPPPRARAGA